MRLLVLLAVCAFCSSCKSKAGPTAPPEPPPYRPQVVQGPREPCMEPPPVTPSLVLPGVELDAGSVVVPVQTYRDLILTLRLLISYIYAQSIRCGVDWDDALENLPGSPDAGT